jgi:hypothetical protein
MLSRCHIALLVAGEDVDDEHGLGFEVTQSLDSAALADVTVERLTNMRWIAYTRTNRREILLRASFASRQFR